MTDEPTSTDHSPALAADQMGAIAGLASDLHQLESSEAPVQAVQYQLAARALARSLADVPADDELCAILIAYPCVIEVYENIHYHDQGLCLGEPEDEALSAQAMKSLMSALRCRV